MNDIFFSDQNFTIPIPNKLAHEQTTLALKMIKGLKIISISSDFLVVSCSDSRITEDFIHKLLVEYKLRNDIEKQLNLDTKQLVQNIINASLGTGS